MDVLNYGEPKKWDTDEDLVEKTERMMSPPFEDVERPKEKYMDRIITRTKEEPKPFYKPQNDGWRDDINLGMFDTGMTTILSPKYNLKDDMDGFDEHEGEDNQISSDHEEQTLEKYGDTKDTDNTDDKGITYNDSHIGQLEADLEETRSNFKLIVHYLTATDERFCQHHENIPVSHESITSFIEKSHLKEETSEKETTSEKSDEQNTVIEDDKDGFTPVIDKHKKKNRNRRKKKKNKKKSLLENTMINVFGNGNGENTSEDSISSTGTEGDGKTQLISSDTDDKELDFQKAEA